MDTIRFAYISLECARIQPHRQPSTVDICVGLRRSGKLNKITKIEYQFDHKRSFQKSTHF